MYTYKFELNRIKSSNTLICDNDFLDKIFSENLYIFEKVKYIWIKDYEELENVLKNGDDGKDDIENYRNRIIYGKDKLFIEEYD